MGFAKVLTLNLFQKDEDGKEAKPAAQQQDKVLFTLVNGQVRILIWISLSLLLRAVTVNLVAGDEDCKCTRQPDSWSQANAHRAGEATHARGGWRGEAV